MDLNSFLNLAGVATDILGLGMSSSSSKKNYNLAREQMDFQQQFARKGIQWRVNDAKLAGIHPLAALGASTVSYKPVQVGVSDLGRSVSRFGQHLSSLSRNKELEEAQVQYAKQQARLIRLQADALDPNIRKETGLNLPGQGVQIKKAEQTHKMTSGITSGINAIYQYGESFDGSLIPTFSKNFEETGESDTFFRWRTYFDRAVLMKDSIQTYRNPSTEKATSFREFLRKIYPNRSPGKGKEYRWNPYKSKWVPRRTTYGGPNQLYDVPPGSRMSGYRLVDYKKLFPLKLKRGNEYDLNLKKSH